MRDIVRQSLLAGLAFGAFMSLFLVPLMMFGGQAWLGVQWSVAAGAVFGLALGVFAAVAARRFRDRLPLDPGERTVHQGPANHLVPGESVGGWLYLTDRRLVFVSHALNVQAHRWDAPLLEIAGVSFCRSLGLVPNGLRIDTRLGPFRFVVSDRGTWRTRLQDVLPGAWATP